MVLGAGSGCVWPELHFPNTKMHPPSPTPLLRWPPSHSHQPNTTPLKPLYQLKLKIQALTPHCVLSWQRVRVANLMASSGSEWVEFFGKHQSGTYNNQYMITDLNK